ncbi:MAG: hypothetical protein WBZ36_01235, partial [Candidatus Nitrosopolaris sp.]
HELTKELACSLTGRTYSKYNNIDLRYIKQTRLNSYVTIVIVDEKVSLVIEIRDDSKGTFDEAWGLSIYSNSREFYHMFPSLKTSGYKLNYMIKLGNRACD